MSKVALEVLKESGAFLISCGENGMTDSDLDPAFAAVSAAEIALDAHFGRRVEELLTTSELAGLIDDEDGEDMSIIEECGERLANAWKALRQELEA